MENTTNPFAKLYGYQKDAVTATLYNQRGIICLPTGTGKCLAKGTKVLMYDGTIKNVEKIIVGDLLMGDDSTPRTVLSLARGSEMMYDIIPIRGDKYTVNESHILSLRTTKMSNNPKKNNITILNKKVSSNEVVDISVIDYLNTTKTAKHVLKGFRVPVNFQQEKNKSLSIAPRLLGLWLADGTSTRPSFTVNDDDVETIKYIKEQANVLSLDFNISYNSENSSSLFLISKGTHIKGSNQLLNFIKENNLVNNKHIPHHYKTASREDRLELLAGILDGDGSMGDNCFELTLVNEKLIDDVIFLARSLGFSCFKKSVIKQIKTLGFKGNYFRIFISGEVDAIPIITERKKPTQRKQIKNVLNYGIKVEPVGIGDYYGFEIDGNRRFLLGDFTVTHNTFAQAAMLANDILMNPDQFRMYVVNAPRILLTYQLLKEVFGFLSKLGIDARYMFVHSGSGASNSEINELRKLAEVEGHNIPFSEIPSGTSPDAIREMMTKAKNLEMPLILFSTYHSANHIETARKSFKTPISMALNDEAHYLVQEKFHDILTTLTTPRCYFFTATRKHTPSDKGRGMNNTELYGEVLYDMKPIEAIALGKMVRPRLHFVRTAGVYTSDDYDRSLNLIIQDTFIQHTEVLVKTKQNPKILVSAKGSQDIRSFLKSDEYKQLRNDNVDIYAIASHEEIGNNINGEEVSRQDFLKRLKKDGADKSKKLIVLHYDILAEGIDVSGFTGIMPLRSLNKSKFLQTFGRAARLDPEDRIRLETGEITSDDIDKMNKPYAYIMIPAVTHSNLDDMDNIKNLITELRDYGFNSSEDIISSTIVNGIPELDELDGLNDLMRRIPQAGELIQDLEADFEAEEEANLSKLDLFNKYKNEI